MEFSVFILIVAIWLSLGVGFILGATWCGLHKINERLDGPE